MANKSYKNLRFLLFCFMFNISCFGQGIKFIERLTAPDKMNGDNFGWKIVAFKDFLFVGSPVQTIKSKGKFYNEAGAVHVFKKNSLGRYQQKQILTIDSASSYDFYGAPIAVNAEFLIIGAFGEDDSNTDRYSDIRQGSVYVYKLSTDGKWILFQILKAPTRKKTDNYGYSCAIADNELLISIPGRANLIGEKREGLIYQYKFNESMKWQITDSIIAPKDNILGFGQEIAITKNNLIVTSKNNCVFYFQKQGEKWHFIEEIHPPKDFEDNFASSLALYDNTLAIGSVGNYDYFEGRKTRPNADSIYLYHYFNKKKEFKTKYIINNKKVLDSLKINRKEFVDNAQVVSLTLRNKYLKGCGVVHLYSLNNNIWELSQTIRPTDATNDMHFGISISMDDNKMIIGAFGHPCGKKLTYCGSTYLFTKNESGVWEEKTKMFPLEKYEWIKYGFSTELKNSSIFIGTRFEKVNSSGSKESFSSGSVYYYEYK